MPQFILLCLLNMLSFISLYCQTPHEKFYTHAIQITSENDNYIWPYHDRYYTNGLNIGFSRVQKKPWLLAGKSSIKQPYKTIMHFKLAHEIYTPDNIKESNITELDRPYAGYLYFHTEVSTFWDRTSNWQLALEGGIIGPWAGGASVQSWWHKLIHYTQPQGWQYQIRNEAVINFRTGYQRAWQVLPWADLLTSGRFQAGTAFNNLSLGLTARMGQINPIDNSAIANSWLNNSFFQKVTPKDQPQEWFTFYGIEGTRVLHNTLIEGSLFPAIKSLHTENTNPYVWTQKIGVVYSTFSTTFKLTMHTLSPEVSGGKNHQYLRIDLGIRF